MNCGEFREHLDEYADGLLDAALHARMNAHAVDCAECAEVLKQTLEIKLALADLEDEAPVPADVSAAWRQAVRREAARKQRVVAWHGWRTFAAAAAALAVWAGATAVMDNAGLLHAPVSQVQPYEYSAAYDLRYIETEPTSQERAIGGEVAAAAYLVPDGVTTVSAGKRAMTTEAAGAGAENGDAVIQPMRVLSARGEIVSPDLDTALANMEDLVSETDGYYEQESETEENGVRRAHLVVRIPVESLDEFLAGLKEIGSDTLLERVERDIARNYYDAQARIVSLTLQRDQYNALIPQAATADEVADLAAKAEEIQLQIDALESEKRTWNTALQYATVDIGISTQAADAQQSLGERMGSALKNTLAFGKDMLVALAHLAPAIIVIAAALVIAKVRRGKKKRNGGE